MKRRIVFGLLAASVVALACNELSGPIRPTGYGFTLVARDSVTADTTVAGKLYHQDSIYTDTIWFHWPESRLPVRIWADTGGGLGLPGHVRDGIALWEQVLQYGEYDATLVGDSTHADVLVYAGVPSDTAGIFAVRMGSMAPQCSGATDIRVSSPDHKKLLLPIRVYIENKYPLGEDSTTWCLGLTVAHELGHSLGLFQHSDSTDDLMSSNPLVPAPTARDVSTVLFLYHFRPDLVPVP
ncbi:MAG TPA: hypothetical protein VFI39_09410 [Gemmatimonadales bacterium]|nr:hypothetical protein [Gemmatimonadales bacterium]